MAKRILVTEKVISKRSSEEIIVTFPIDEELYKAIISSCTNESRIEHMTFEYYAYLQERYYQRHTLSIDETDDEGKPIRVLEDKKEEQTYDQEIFQKLREIFNYLNKEVQELLIDVFIKNKTHEQIAKEKGLGRTAITMKLSRTLAMLKKYLEEK